MLYLNHAVPSQCTVCGGLNLSFLGEKDFGISGGDFFAGRRLYKDHGQVISYHLCESCGFVFSVAFDGWGREDFIRHIYNDDYVIGDPPFLEERPKRNAAMVAALFWREKDTVKVLDFGGGRGLFAAELTGFGFRADSLDAYHEPGADTDTDYDLITSFEVIEHVPHSDQYAWLVQLKSHLKASTESTVLIGTELMDGNDFSWWFVSPRNGHISIHSRLSFSILCERVGLNLQSISRSVHLLRINESPDRRTPDI